jgi:hypothetical protein
VLEHVGEHDRVEAAIAEIGLEQVLPQHVEPEPLTRVRRRERARLHAQRVPAAVSGLGQEEPHPAAEVEQGRDAVAVAPGGAGRVPLDPLQRDPRRLPLPRLLLHVVLRLGLAVRLAQLGLRGEAVELHVAAGGAADDVAERGAEELGGGDQVLGPRALDAPVGPEDGRGAGGAGGHGRAS